MALKKLAPIRTPFADDDIWIVPVSKTLQLGCVIAGCMNPECTCSELVLTVHSLDESVRGFGHKSGALVLSRSAYDDQTRATEAPFHLSLDVSTGELRKQGVVVDGLADRRVAAILDALDAETLDRFEAIWRRGKRLPSTAGERKADLGGWEEGDIELYWDDAFEVDRPEAFADGDDVVVALDLYCIVPGCDCRKVRVAFCVGTREGQPTKGEVGLVVVHFEGRVELFPPSAELEPRLRALWARYRQRHPELQTLRERYEAMRGVAVELASQPILAPSSAAYANAKRGSSLVWVPTSRKRKDRTRRR